jgi:hypothetical protein
MHYISYIGPVWTASPALDPQNLDPNLKKVCQTPSTPLVGLLHQIDGSTPRFTKLVDLLKECSTRSNFGGVERNYPLLSLITQK